MGRPAKSKQTAKQLNAFSLYGNRAQHLRDRCRLRNLPSFPREARRNSSLGAASKHIQELAQSNGGQRPSERVWESYEPCSDSPVEAQHVERM